MTYKNIGNDALTEQDRDNARAFILKVTSNMSRTAFEQMRYAFRHKLEISSQWVIIHRMAALSGVVPLWIDCCPNSCIAYTKDYAKLESCLYCGEQRHHNSGHARRQFCYVPLIPRLQGFFQSCDKIKQLRYRHN